MHDDAGLLPYLIALASAACTGGDCCGTAGNHAQASMHALLACEGAPVRCMRDERCASCGKSDLHLEHVQVVVPELELEVSTGTLGGLVTTVEGLVRAVETALKNTQVRCDLALCTCHRRRLVACAPCCIRPWRSKRGVCWELTLHGGLRFVHACKRVGGACGCFGVIDQEAPGCLAISCLDD